MGVGGQRHAPAALPPGKVRYPLYRRLVGPQGRSVRLPIGIRSPDRPARSESLYRLSYPGSLSWDSIECLRKGETIEQERFLEMSKICLLEFSARASHNIK